MAWRRLLFFLGRVPFAASLWVLVALIGIANGTWAHKLPPATLALWGFGLDQLWRGRWWTLVTGAVFVHGPWMYWALLVLFVPLTVGAYEWLAGTRRVLIVYWTTDIGGALLVAELGRQLAYAHDVGMSGGGFGCLGAAVNRLPGRWRRESIGLAVVYLLIRIAISVEIRPDVLHLVTFCGGLALDRCLGRGSIAGADPARRS